MEYHGRMSRSLIIGCAVFIVILCVLFALLSDALFTKALYERYNAFLGRVIGYVDLQIDKPDLKNCLSAGQTSEKYAELQRFLNEYVDAFELYYLYIIKFTSDNSAIMNVCSATSARERAAGESDMPLLEVTYAYSQEEIDKYVKAWNSDGASFFEESSDYGFFYTACLPVRMDSGEVIALICADIDINAIHMSKKNNILLSTILAAVICVVFSVLLLFWLHRNVTGPIYELEASARRFANMDRGKAKDTRFLFFVPPRIRVKNEVKSLSDAIEKMTVEMKNYVNGIIAAERNERTAKEEAAGFQTIAYQDALTRVKSKAAYAEAAEQLDASIREGKAEFAIVMVDLNNLKKINDNYGHANGDKYIIGTTQIICGIYKHSPVYRVGGDEFVVILTGQDYRHREELLHRARGAFRASYEDTSGEPWERCSAAVGMSEYTGAPGETVETVYNRADDMMYQNKQKIKAELHLS